MGRVGRSEARLSLWSDPDRHYVARLRELSPVADPATRTYAARFSLPQAGDDVRLGMTATLILSEGQSDRIARLPLSALFNQGSGPAVWTVDPRSGRLSLKPVEVAGFGASSVLVREGVVEGDTVVALGVQKLDEGSRVRVVQALGL